jgi:hypothetical protein
LFENSLKSKDLAFRVILDHDNAAGHMQDFGLSHSIVQVEYLSSIATSLLQPLIQAIFETCYMCHAFCSVVDASEETFAWVSGC